MGTRGFICVIFGLAMTVFHLLSSDFSISGMLRALLLGGVAFVFFYAFFAVANKITNNGVDDYFSDLKNKKKNS